ncbi:hypothetical protein [Cohnella sp. CFH 77786]|uniref:hypothetical protein n=1 Tax=Cohnella sp. CFH 77786 TaxID=2662265 RepID=UPI002102E286|nr:hypothetical protein [Cohnella sp. CFH 77786]
MNDKPVRFFADGHNLRIGQIAQIVSHFIKSTLQQLEAKDQLWRIHVELPTAPFRSISSYSDRFFILLPL